MRRTPACLTACLALALLASGCTAGPSEPVVTHGTGMVSCVQKDQGFSVTLRSQPEVARPGGEFSLTLTVRNLSGEKRDFVLPDARTYEFKAFARGGDQVWSSGQGSVSAQVITTVSFQPDDSRVYKLAWDTTGRATGDYTVQGYFLGLPDVRPSVPVVITP